MPCIISRRCAFALSVTIALILNLTVVHRVVSAAPDDRANGSAWYDGTAHLDLRLRHEVADDAGFADIARATTLRVRLNYLTDTNRKLSFFGELDSVLHIGSERFNSGGGTSGPERARYPVIADPDGTEINQLYVQHKATTWMARAGRQRIQLDNQRFVGNVGWRQNEQTYDALLVQATPVEDLTATYAYINNVNRIFGNSVSAGDHDNKTHLFNLRRNFGADAQVGGHLYRIHNQDEPSFSTLTYGISAQGALPALRKLVLNAEVFNQESVANNPNAVGGVYWHLRGRFDYDAAQLFAGIEVLPGHATEPGRAFRTPLATLHGFNGWADKFLTTPDRGLVDRYAGLKGNHFALNWQITAHSFKAEEGSSSYGTELDFSVAKKWFKKYQLLLKYADFNSKDPAYSEATRFWLMVSASY